MNTVRHLPNAPIQEAVIEIRTNLARNFGKADLDEIKQHFSDQFSAFSEIVTFGGKIAFSPASEQPIVQGSNKALLGYRLDSTDGKHILQIRNNGLTFSRLPPYTNWEQLRSSAQEYWAWFTSFREIANISRLGVRYINRIVLPFPIDDLSDYFTAPPSLPEGVPRSLENFFTKVSVQYPGKGIMANIVHAFEKSDEKDGVHIILDIDAFSSRPNFVESEVWPFLEALRDALRS